MTPSLTTGNYRKIGHPLRSHKPIFQSFNVSYDIALATGRQLKKDVSSHQTAEGGLLSKLHLMLALLLGGNCSFHPGIETYCFSAYNPPLHPSP